MKKTMVKNDINSTQNYLKNFSNNFDQILLDLIPKKKVFQTGFMKQWFMLLKWVEKD